MSKKGKKSAKKGVIAVSVILALLVIGVSALAISLFLPHQKKALSMYPAAGHSIAYNGRFSYRCADGLTAFYVDSDTDLSQVLEDKDPQSDDMGEQTLKVRMAGLREYRTDNMGVWMSYPVIVYEYVGD